MKMLRLDNIHWQWVIAVIVLLALSRFIPHPPNFTPIGAMAILSGGLFKSLRMGLTLPLAAMLLSDLIIGLHSSMFFVYAALALIAISCHFLLRRINVLSVSSAVIFATAIFFLLTNFGAWLSHDMYPHSAQGLWLAYVAGLPFLLNSLLANIGFTALACMALFTLSQRESILPEA
jgi:hypothetical protein